MYDVIIGAGITGLAAGIRTGAPIYEASGGHGGICTSYEMGGYTFQNGGGHWLFGDNAYKSTINQFSELNEHTRIAGININDKFQYPIQARDQEEEINPGTLKHWMEREFGPGLCNVFFHPFNERYTAGYYNHVIQDDKHKSPKKGKGYNSTFAYPEKGLSNLVDNLAAQNDIRYNKRLTKVDMKNKIACFSDGEEVKYDRLISTVPLDKMLDICGIAHNILPYTSVIVLNIGAYKGPNLPKDHWIYYPKTKSGFYRVGIYSNVDSRFAPEGKCSIYIERSFDGLKSDRSQMDFRKYERGVIEELQDMGFIVGRDVVHQNWINHAYTWIFPGCSAREQGIERLKELDIISTGRYGKWKFQGIMESFADGMML